MDRTQIPAKILIQARKDPIIVCDTQERRSWLVPILSVLLQMVHAWVRVYGVEIRFPFADPSFDGGQAAYNALQNCLNQEIGIQTKNAGFVLADLIAQFWFNLTKLCHRDTILGKRPPLYGYNFMDIVKERPEATLRKCEIGTNVGWYALVNLVDIVIVCDGLGDVIIPSSNFCPKWASIPMKMDLLATTIKCLIDATQDQGPGDLYERITKGWKWHSPADPFAKCQGTCDWTAVSTSCDRVQQLVRKDYFCTPPQDIYDQGAVVFGKAPKSPNNILDILLAIFLEPHVRK